MRSFFELTAMTLLAGYVAALAICGVAGVGHVLLRASGL